MASLAPLAFSAVALLTRADKGTVALLHMELEICQEPGSDEPYVL